MNSLSLYTDQMVKQEQYKDLLREAEHYRLVKVVAQPGPKRLEKVAVALRKGMVGQIQHLPSLRTMNRARI